MPGSMVRPHPPCGHLPPQAGEGKLAHSARSRGIHRTANVGKPFLPPSHGGRCPKGGWGPRMAAVEITAHAAPANTLRTGNSIRKKAAFRRLFDDLSAAAA